MARILALLAIPEDRRRPAMRLDQLSWLGPIPEPVRQSMRRMQADAGFWDDIGVMTRHEVRQWHGLSPICVPPNPQMQPTGRAGLELRSGAALLVAKQWKR